MSVDRRGAARFEPDASLQRRASGVLLHVTSLPGAAAGGDLGGAARRFVGWLARAEQTFWQILPLNPVSADGSPYSGPSTFAGNAALIDREPLLREGWLRRDEPLWRACERMLELRAHHRALEELRYRARCWLPDYALFVALCRRFGSSDWTTWPLPLRVGTGSAKAAARRELARDIALVELEQLLFAQQWDSLRDHAASHGIRIIGDLPIYVAHHSSDVWAHQHLFALDQRGQPSHVSGVPPDAFSARGQRWGTPIFRWDAMRADGYRWWSDRVRTMLDRVDLVRLDHFIGFARYWEIPAEADARAGRWVDGPGVTLFEAIARALDRRSLPFIAEDLGCVSEQVIALREALALPGMKVAQFGFGIDGAHEHHPAAWPVHSVGYTGTHDNDTLRGWLAAGPPELRRSVMRELGVAHDDDAAQRLIEAVLRSRARTVIVPMQDLLGLGGEARMNTPGRAEGNWSWRMSTTARLDELAERLRGMTRAAARMRDGPET
ncbi:MAG TPA: 4-alpha-glucanotransferase [Nannocystaceae bacterium]|nr:4-alpha-glucanotransferase [Nannocystaceae bacterium]